MSGAQEAVGAAPGADKRTEARKRLEQKRNLQGGVIAYVVINAFLIGVWATTGAGYLLAGLGPRRLGSGDAPRRPYFRGPITEADIDEELRRMT